MLKTDIMKEIDGVLRSEGITKSEASRRAGICRQSFNNMEKYRKIINPTIERVMDVLGYDIEIEFVKRK